MFLTERGHAGEAGLGRFCLHTRITMDDIIFLGFAFLCSQVDLALVRLQVEGLHDRAEGGVFLQLWFSGEDGPTLRTAVGVLPGFEETVLAEVVSTGDGHRTVKGTETNTAGQLSLQTLSELTVVHCSHDVTTEELRGETKLNLSRLRKRK